MLEVEKREGKKSKSLLSLAGKFPSNAVRDSSIL